MSPRMNKNKKPGKRKERTRQSNPVFEPQYDLPLTVREEDYQRQHIAPTSTDNVLQNEINFINQPSGENVCSELVQENNSRHVSEESIPSFVLDNEGQDSIQRFPLSAERPESSEHSSANTIESDTVTKAMSYPETEAFRKQVAAKNLDAISENMRRKGRVIDLYIVNLPIDPININPENTSTGMMETDALDWGTTNGTKHLHSDVKSYGHFAEMEKIKKNADEIRKDFEVLQKKMKLNQQMAMKKKESQGIIFKLIESNDNSEERVLQIMKSVKDTGNTTDSAIEQTEAFWKQVAAKNLDAISENMKRKGRVIDLYIVNLTIDPININPENTSTDDVKDIDEDIDEGYSENNQEKSANLLPRLEELCLQFSVRENDIAIAKVASISTPGEHICENEMPKEKNVIDKQTEVFHTRTRK